MKFLHNPRITIAEHKDIPVITSLLNRAYRGESSKQGWTTEAHLIAGEVRADENMIQETMDKPDSVFLMYTDEAGAIAGCVNLQKHDNRIYLGMLSVWPQLQGKGIGKKLLQAANDYALLVNCRSVYMSVISARTELIDWYKRHGYSDTGERKPFPEDGITGTHLQPLEFIILEKKL
jgi:ribosomal protein S18 acetylase RimI-like enzyme